MSACLDPGKRLLWNQIGADGAARTGRRSEACRAGGALRASRRAPKSGGHSGGAIRLFRGARRCGLSGARSLLPGVLERLRLGLTSPSTQPLLPGRAGASPTSLSRRASGSRCRAQLELARHVWDACGDWPSVAGTGKPTRWSWTPGVVFPVLSFAIDWLGQSDEKRFARWGNSRF